ncbi:MAG: lytic murein transglycosylase, partial [Gemmatimonadaceae bacterium]|nr:lytic murein transglycosylase [Gemmatimonadaceae bacterium]
MLLATLLGAPRVVAAQLPLATCVDSLQRTPQGARLAPDTWAMVRELTADSTVLAQLDAQPEFRLALWDYLAVMTDDERVRDGQTAMRTHRSAIDSVVARFNVPASVLAAIWGIESNFGSGSGRFSVVRSVATLACVGRRQRYFREELYAALRILERGDITSDQFLGSWAGAFGQVQFMPRSFESRAVDLDGDGRRDLIGHVGDALASAARYLRGAGWVPGVPWGIEVMLPRAFTLPAKGRRDRRTLAQWARAGVRRVDGSPLATRALPPTTRAGLLVPTTPEGPLFLVTHNFEAILRYNAAIAYALAVAHLADRLDGKAATFATPWPTDDGGLSRDERRELQALLRARGHAVGTPTALLTPEIIAAVRAEQERLGWPVTARPGQRLLIT